MSIGVQLLVVDDEPVALQAVAHTLRHLTIETCASPVSALLRLCDGSFSVVLSDFHMPDLNGLGLLLAARERGSQVSFILMTGDSTDAMLTEGLRYGMFALLNKPLNPSTFIPLVQQVIECHRLRQEVTELRQTVRETAVAWGSLMGKLAVPTAEVFQTPLPY